jgi:DNA-binding XRE family transcriptional regulator
MATKTNTPKRPLKRRDSTEELARLRAEVAQLRAEIRTLRERVSTSPTPVPELPAPDVAGNYPAAETLRAIVARQLVKRRQAAGWTQAELAALAGVRQETISRLESGKNAPNVATVDKLDRTLRAAGV